MMNLSNSGPNVLNNDWNVEFIDDSVVLKKGTNETLYMLNDYHKKPFEMEFLGTFDILDTMGLELKYDEYIYIDNDDYRRKMFSINDNCKINVLMKKLNKQIQQTFTNEELNKINVDSSSQLNDYPIYYKCIIELINKQKHKINDSEQ